MLIKTPKGDYVSYKETDSIVIKKKNIDRMYGESTVEVLFITLVRENGTQLLLDMVGNNELIEDSILKRMAEREVENLALNIVKNKGSDVVEMIRPNLKEIKREIRELAR